MSRTSWFKGLWARRLCTLATMISGLIGCSSNHDRSNATSNDIGQHGSAVITTWPVVADAYVRSGSQAATNFGNATTLLADGDDGGSIMHIYVRFSIGNVGTISSAKLRLFATDPTSQTYVVRKVSSNSWGETTITWNNKPAPDAGQITSFSSVADNTWVEIDFTGVAQPNSTLSIVIEPSGATNGVDFNSRNATSNQPQVVIDASGSGGTGGTGGAGGATGGTGGTGGTAGSGGTGGTGGSTSTVPTDPNLKIAFVGDTADGTNWGSVLSLAQAEGAHAVVVEGDMTYDADPSGWWSRTEGVVGQSFPVFLARGNHDDSSWSGFLSEAANHFGGATRTNGPHDAAYKAVFRGLAIATIRKGDTATTLNNLLNGDTHIWKVCNWHQNQNKMQVGGKGDEMGWAVYEACRQQGALIMTGHEHTYHRTKTMTNTQNQTIDPTCSSGASVCVGPGRTFVAVVGTGGTGLRSQVRCTPTSSTQPYPSLNTTDPSCPIWASIYTTNQGANFGAQFITFNVDGNPRKARSYFKTISGTTIDNFVIFAD